MAWARVALQPPPPPDYTLFRGLGFIGLSEEGGDFLLSIPYYFQESKSVGEGIVSITAWRFVDVRGNI